MQGNQRESEIVQIVHFVARQTGFTVATSGSCQQISAAVMMTQCRKCFKHLRQLLKTWRVFLRASSALFKWHGCKTDCLFWPDKWKWKTDAECVDPLLHSCLLVRRSGRLARGKVARRLPDNKTNSDEGRTPPQQKEALRQPAEHGEAEGMAAHRNARISKTKHHQKVKRKLL